jgi:PST family polysaccharide transporter
MKLSQGISRILHHSLFHNMLSLYGVQIASYFIPLITVPYLARVLGAGGWGLVAFAQAFGFYLALLGQYGFDLSATREVARYRNDREKLTEILAGVQGAKLLLAIGCLFVAALASLSVRVFREHPALLWAGMFWTIPQVFSMMWFFQGFERMRLVAALDIAGKALATVLIFVVIRRPDDGWKVLAVQGLGFFFSLAIGLWCVYRDFPFRMPTWVGVREALRMGWSMFLFRSSMSLYTTGNAFILGLFVSPQLVGYYAGAEKISKALLGLLNPVSLTLYPRLSHLVHQSRERAARLARIGVMVMGGGGVLMGGVIFLGAPLLVHLVLGRNFEAAVPVLRILALLAPLISLSNVFGIQWMLPLGMDRAFNTIILLAGVINVILAVILAPVYSDIGMAWAVVSAEAFVTGGIYLLLRWQKLDPMSYASPVEG